GRFPVEAVTVMERILLEAERILPSRAGDPGSDVPAMIADAACRMAERVGAGAIVVPTRSGATARRVARHRPPMPIVPLTPDETTRRRLSPVWGVTAV